VCRQLKANVETRDIPIIFISVDTEVEERVTGFQLGAVDFISKPFQQRELLARVKTHLALRQAQEQLLRQTTDLLLANEKLLVEVEERKQVEIARQRVTEELVAKRAELQTVITATFDAIIAINHQGLVTVFNPPPKACLAGRLPT